MIYISKSKYVKALQCEKLLWLDKYKPGLAEYSSGVRRRFAAGGNVGECAKALFGGYTDATAFLPDGRLDIRAMKERTLAALSRGDDVICEAALSADGLYCAVDILKKTAGGYALYEVKSSLGIKANYITDAAYQKYVLEKCGLTVTACHIVTLNGDYVRQGSLDVEKLLRIRDVSAQTDAYMGAIPPVISRMRDVLSSDTEPQTNCGRQCSSPYDCPFLAYCTNEHTLFELYGNDKKNEWLDAGLLSFRDLISAGVPLTEMQRRQIEYAYSDLPIYTDKKWLSHFLSGLKYPLYFLDFETAMPEIPEFDGARPYMTLPFMFSVHRIEKEGGEPAHFCKISTMPDPRREIANALDEIFTGAGSIVAYNAAFEKRMLTELGGLFPEYKTKFDMLAEKFVDLLEVFKGGYVYNKRMGGSFSLKSVAPAMLPGEPSVDYSRLAVQDGNDAMSHYCALKNAADEEKNVYLNNLLEYSAVDTLSLVKIVDKLKKLLYTD